MKLNSLGNATYNNITMQHFILVIPKKTFLISTDNFNAKTKRNRNVIAHGCDNPFSLF